VENCREAYCSWCCVAAEHKTSDCSHASSSFKRKGVDVVDSQDPAPKLAKVSGSQKSNYASVASGGVATSSSCVHVLKPKNVIVSEVSGFLNGLTGCDFPDGEAYALRKEKLNRDKQELQRKFNRQMEEISERESLLEKEYQCSMAIKVAIENWASVANVHSRGLGSTILNSATTVAEGPSGNQEESKAIEESPTPGRPRDDTREESMAIEPQTPGVHGGSDLGLKPTNSPSQSQATETGEVKMETSSNPEAQH